MKLYGRYRSPFTRRCAVALKRLGHSFEHHPVTVWNDHEEVQALNPLARVPCLVLADGEVLIDSTMILDYVDTELAGPDERLVPEPGPERRQVLRLTAVAMGALEKAVTSVYEQAMRPQERVHPPWLDHCRSQVTSGMDALDRVDADPWLSGARFTLADLSTVVLLDFVAMNLPDLVPDAHYPQLDALRRRCADWPPVRDTHPDA